MCSTIHRNADVYTERWWQDQNKWDDSTHTLCIVHRGSSSLLQLQYYLPTCPSLPSWWEQTHSLPTHGRPRPRMYRRCCCRCILKQKRETWNFNEAAWGWKSVLPCFFGAVVGGNTWPSLHAIYLDEYRRYGTYGTIWCDRLSFLLLRLLATCGERERDTDLQLSLIFFLNERTNHQMLFFFILLERGGKTKTDVPK